MKMPKDSHLGKGYSYLVAIILTIGFALLHIDYRIDCKNSCNYYLGRKDVDTPTTLFFLFSISGLLGLPTDHIACSVAKLISGEGNKDN